MMRPELEDHDSQEEEWHNVDSASKRLICEQDAPTRRSYLFLYKASKTFSIIGVWMCLGMIQAIAGPTLPDLRDRLNTNMEDLSLALGFRGFGALCGSVICGMLADRYREAGDVIMGVAVITAGLPEIIKPLTHSLVVVGVVSFIGGMGQGGIDAVGHGMILWMWGEKSGPPFHAIHMGYPIGAMLAPLIAMSFLGPDDQHITNSNVIALNKTDTTTVSRIEVAYGIVGGISCTVGLIFVIWYFIGTPKNLTYHGTAKSSYLEVFSLASCRSLGSLKHTCFLLFLVCTFYVFESAKDGTIAVYIFSYAVETDLDFTKQEAAKLDATGRFMEIVGRAIGILASHWFRIQPLIFIEVISNALFVTCLVFFGTQSHTKLWVFLCLFKLCAAPVWPSGMTWISTHLKFSSMIAALIQVVLGISSFFVNWTAGYLYDNFTDWLMFYAMLCGYAVLVVLITMQIVASCCTGPDKDTNDISDEYFVHQD